MSIRTQVSRTPWIGIRDKVNKHGLENQRFFPNLINDLVLWLDAADTATVTHSGGAVSLWKDKSGKNNNATQSSGALQPQFALNQINGLPGFNVGAANSYMVMDRNITFQSYSIFSVLKNTRTYPDATNDIDSIFCVQTAGSFPTFYSFSGFSGVDTDPAIGFSNVTTTEFYINGTPNVPSSTTFTVNTNVILASRGTDTETNNHPMNVLGRASQSWAHSGPVGEIIFFNRSLTDAEMNAVGGYLRDKWKLTWNNL